MAGEKRRPDGRVLETQRNRTPRLLPKRLVQSGLREKIDGERLVERLQGLSIGLQDYHASGQFLEKWQADSLRLEMDSITKALSYILPTLSAQRVEKDEREGNVIESGVIMLPETDPQPAGDGAESLRIEGGKGKRSQKE